MEPLNDAQCPAGATRAIVTHGDKLVMVLWLQQQGLQASSFRTELGAQDDNAPPLPAVQP